jgi:hypothetical protein
MHPTDTQIEGYARRTLDPADLLAVDDHLASCVDCRQRAGARVPLADGVTQLWEAAVDRAPSSASVRWMPYAAAAAAAVVLLVLVPVALRWRAGAGPGLAGLETLPPEHRARVRAALQAGVAEPPADLAELRGRAGVLMGSPPAESFRLIEPLGTVTVSDRPAFRWSPLAGADAYTVAVADEDLRLVAQSPPVSGTEWTPATPLPRRRVYLWQVTARRGAESATAPAPHAPPAKFRVVDEDTARLLDRVARERPDAHLVLGILYAQAGATAEAVRHLAQVPHSDRHATTARRTLEELGVH